MPCPLPIRLHPNLCVSSSSKLIEGRQLRLSPSATPSARPEKLIVGDGGITLVHDNSKAQVVTVCFANTEALLSWDDGTRVLYGDDGFRLEVDPNLWADAEVAMGAVDKGVAPRRVVPMGAAPVRNNQEPAASAADETGDDLAQDDDC